MVGPTSQSPFGKLPEENQVDKSKKKDIEPEEETEDDIHTSSTGVVTGFIKEVYKRTFGFFSQSEPVDYEQPIRSIKQRREYSLDVNQDTEEVLWQAQKAVEAIGEMKEIFSDLKDRAYMNRHQIRKEVPFGTNWLSSQLYKWIAKNPELGSVIEDFDEGLQEILKKNDKTISVLDPRGVKVPYVVNGYVGYNQALSRYIQFDPLNNKILKNSHSLEQYLAQNPEVTSYINNNIETLKPFYEIYKEDLQAQAQKLPQAKPISKLNKASRKKLLDSIDKLPKTNDMVENYINTKISYILVNKEEKSREDAGYMLMPDMDLLKQNINENTEQYRKNVDAVLQAIDVRMKDSITLNRVPPSEELYAARRSVQSHFIRSIDQPHLSENEMMETFDQLLESLRSILNSH